MNVSSASILAEVRLVGVSSCHSYCRKSVNQLVSAITLCCATFGHWQLSSLNPTPGNRSSDEADCTNCSYMRLTALPQTWLELRLSRRFHQHLFSNQATEQPSAPNSKAASPSASSAPCPSPLLHIKRLPTIPRRALIARSPGPQINHTRLPRSS